MQFKDKVIRGIEWSIVSNVGGQIINFFIMVVLARLLSPKEFGLVGMITVLTNFALLFNSVGLGEALVQKKEIDDGHLQAVFWINLVMGIGLMLITMVISPFLARFFHEPSLKPLTLLISMNFFILSLKSVQRAILLKGMQFKRIAKIDLSADIIAGAVAIVFAALGFGPWSLVIRTLLLSVAIVSMLWFGSSWRPKLTFPKEKAKELIGFGSNLVGSNIAFYWTKNIDNLLIGKFLGSAPLGIYSRAYGLMLLPVRQITNVIGMVMFPALSSISHEKERIKKIFLKTLTAIALVTFPLMSWLLIISREFILVIYGNKWAEVAPILQILSVFGLTLSINMAFRWILMSMGKTALLFKLTIVEFIVVSSAIFLGLESGLSRVAINITIGSCVFIALPYWMLSGKLIDLKLREIAAGLSIPFFCSSLMGGVIFVMKGLLHENLRSDTLTLTLLTLLGGVIYLTMIHLLKVKVFREMISIIRARVKRPNPA